MTVTRALVVLGFIATPIVFAVRLIATHRPPKKPRRPRKNHHVLPVGMQVIRGASAGLVVAFALRLLVIVLLTSEGRLDSLLVSVVTLSSAALVFSPTMLRRYKHDGFWWLSVLAGYLPVIAGYFSIIQQDNPCPAVIVMIFAGAGAAITTAVLDKAKVGEWVWMWQKSSWEWTFWPRFGRKSSSASGIVK